MTRAQKRTITLTGRAPVRIAESAWPQIARADRTEEDGAIQRRWHLLVRRHADGRILIYGIKLVLGVIGLSNDIHGGELLEPGELTKAEVFGEIPNAILRVAHTIGLPELAQVCCAQLPAVELDGEHAS